MRKTRIARAVIGALFVLWGFFGLTALAAFYWGVVSGLLYEDFDRGAFGILLAIVIGFAMRFVDDLIVQMKRRWWLWLP